MKLLLRLLVTFISGVAALYFVFWVGGAILFALHLPLWISLGVAVVVALAVARYVWMRTASLEPGLVNSIVLGAFVTGGLGSREAFSGPSSSRLARIKARCSVFSSRAH